MKFTVLIPTHANGEVIRCAIESVLAQTLGPLEVFVVADGAPEETHAIVEHYAAHDSRLRLFKFEKGERHGEAWRRLALEEARGDAVCYLSDDDFWFPDHLVHMRTLLSDADFAHTRVVYIDTNFTVRGPVDDLANPEVRHRLLSTRLNFFGLSVAGHRMDAYRRLPVGWSPAPPDLQIDLHMWRKWLAIEDMRCKSSAAITSIHLARSERATQNSMDCFFEARYWSEVFKDPAMRSALRELLPSDNTSIPLATITARAREGLYPDAPVAPTQSVAPRYRFRGCLDHVGHDRIDGWAWDEAHPNARVMLRVLDNGRSVAETRADQYREDLEGAGIGDGRHGFSLTVPGGFTLPDRHVVQILLPDGRNLDGSPWTLEATGSISRPLPT